jgi:hypothetical protein
VSSSRSRGEKIFEVIRRERICFSSGIRTEGYRFLISKDTKVELGGTSIYFIFWIRSREFFIVYLCWKKSLCGR